MIQYFQPCSGSIAITTDKNYTGSSIAASGLLSNTFRIPLLFSTRIGIATGAAEAEATTVRGTAMAWEDGQWGRGGAYVWIQPDSWDGLPPAANVNGDELQYSFHHGELSVVL